MSYRTALHHANAVLGLAGKASKYIKELFDAPDVSTVRSFISFFYFINLFNVPDVSTVRSY